MGLRDVLLGKKKLAVHHLAIHSTHVTPHEDIQDSELSSLDAPAPPAGAAPQTLEENERGLILAALDRNNGNRTATAIELGISRRTLHYRLQEYQEGGAPTAGPPGPPVDKSEE